MNIKQFCQWAACVAGLSISAMVLGVEPDYDKQSGLKQTQPEGAWALAQQAGKGKGEGVVVVVLDSVAEITHPDLVANVVSSTEDYNFIQDLYNPPSGYHGGHGIHIAGIIAAAENGQGILGIAPKARVLPMRVLNKDLHSENGIYCGSLTSAQRATDRFCKTLPVISGLNAAAQYALDNPTTKVVVNLSLGSPAELGYCSAIDDLYSANAGLDTRMIIVAAAMNENTDEPRYPAACGNSNIFAVAAADEVDGRWVESALRGSNYGGWVDLAAPGKSVYSTWWGDSYTELSGTSQATAFVSGALAALLSYNGSITPQQAMALLLQNADPLKNDWLGTGKGRLNLSNAMAAAPSPPPAPGNTPPQAPSGFNVTLQ